MANDIFIRNSNPARCVVFWDLENVSAGKHNIEKAVAGLRALMNEEKGVGGSVKVFRAYTAQRPGLDVGNKFNLSNITLVDSWIAKVGDRAHVAKEVVDKAIIVDMFSYFLQAAEESGGSMPHTIILVSGDRDFVPALARLKDAFGHRIVVVPGCHHRREIYEIADRVVPWHDVLGEPEPAVFPRAPGAAAVAAKEPRVDWAVGWALAVEQVARLFA